MVHAAGEFDFEINIYGAIIVTRKHLNLGRCLSDGGVDTSIKLLKDDLDILAKRMKAPIRQQHQGAAL